MAHVKAGGTSKNNHDSPGQRLGVKLYANREPIKTGQTIVRRSWLIQTIWQGYRFSSGLYYLC